MNDREARRRARRRRQGAAPLLDAAELAARGALVDLADWTDDGSDEQQAQLVAELRYVGSILLQRAPAGWTFTPRAAAGEWAEQARQAGGGAEALPSGMTPLF
ncbi:hypothetical protein JOL79_07025 [Microbispora sp. RL4-1S]|uniref:Uncharacterized protein n=1 Tax=Microbispora oryzae TaxID=2806554 RepID=A0A940WM16_9ACTN|nr:hypothetical protein [Microbispora oryzae]MBP2703551.1 hypothetical protein [Microbispora oryzae]